MPTGSPPHFTPPEAEPFRCETSRRHDSACIVAIGDLDLDTTPILRAEIHALRAGGCKRVTVDLSRLEFMGSTGLRCILDYDAEARRDGFTLALVPGPPAVQRVFELTRTVGRLSFIDP